MTGSRTGEKSQPPRREFSADWTDVPIRWPDADGPWLIAAHWAKVNGRLIIVGLDVRSYREEPSPDGDTVEHYPVGDQFAEVTQPVLRGISITKIRDTTREILIGATPSPEDFRQIPPDGVGPDILKDPETAEAIAGWLTERLSLLTAKGDPLKRRPAAGEDHLRRVAALYLKAIGSGSKSPAKDVEEELRRLGEPRLSTQGGRVQVRQWIRRARERGYLDPPKGSEQ